MDLILMLFGAFVFGLGAFTIGGVLGLPVALFGIFIGIYGLVINHQDHQGKK